jgi:hypothetical protein
MFALLSERRYMWIIDPRLKLSYMKGSTDPELRNDSQLRSLLKVTSPLTKLIHTLDSTGDFLREVTVLLGRRQSFAMLKKCLRFKALSYWESGRVTGHLFLRKRSFGVARSLTMDTSKNTSKTSSGRFITSRCAHCLGWGNRSTILMLGTQS